MILNTSFQGAVNARSQHVSVKVENAATTSRNQHTQANSSSVQHAWESFREEVDSDPVFAREMTEAITFIPNRMSVN